MTALMFVALPLGLTPSAAANDTDCSFYADGCSIDVCYYFRLTTEENLACEELEARELIASLVPTVQVGDVLDTLGDILAGLTGEEYNIGHAVAVVWDCTTYRGVDPEGNHDPYWDSTQHQVHGGIGISPSHDSSMTYVVSATASAGPDQEGDGDQSAVPVTVAAGEKKQGVATTADFWYHRDVSYAYVSAGNLYLHQDAQGRSEDPRNFGQTDETGRDITGQWECTSFSAEQISYTDSGERPGSSDVPLGYTLETAEAYVLQVLDEYCDGQWRRVMDEDHAESALLCTPNWQD